MIFFELPSQDTTLAALTWLSKIMKKKDVPYQIVGGLAAKAYGSNRPLVDIDILVPFRYLEVLADEMKKYLEYPPKHHLSEEWDMTYMALNYRGQRIEIGDGEGAKIFDRDKGKWQRHVMNFDHSKWIKFHKIDLSFIPKAHLLEYKKILSRDVDLQDILEIESAHKEI